MWKAKSLFVLATSINFLPEVVTSVFFQLKFVSQELKFSQNRQKMVSKMHFFPQKIEGGFLELEKGLKWWVSGP